MKNTLKVVLADDEALIRLDIREMLTEAGHEVAGEANNGEDAVAMTRALQPDLVIMDVKMPQHSPGLFLAASARTPEAYSLGVMPVTFLKWREK